MNTEAKTAPELETLIMDRVRNHIDCGNLTGVTVANDENGSTWRVVAEHFSGAGVSPNCKREILAAVQALRHLYHMQTD